MPQPDLVPLARLMDVRLDQLVERLVEQLPQASPYYASLSLEQRQSAAANIYKIIRASVEENGIAFFAQAIAKVAHDRIAQGGTAEDLRLATQLVSQINLSLVDELAHDEPNAAAPAFAWLDRLSFTSLQVFMELAQEELSRQAEELNISIALSERLEQAQRLSEVVEAVFEQLPRLNVDRAIMSLSSEDSTLHEVAGIFDRDESAPAEAAGTRFSPDPLLREAPVDAVYLPIDIADSDLPDDLRELLAPSRIQTLVAFPLRDGQEPRGLLILGYRQQHQLGDDDQRFLALLARMLRNRIANLALIESLQQSNADQQHMLELLRQLSTPLVPMMEGILVMPIVGEVDTRRALQIMETLLAGVTRAGADTIILDITGVPLVDTGVANALVQAARAVRLVGAEAILVGITPEVAQTLVGLGVNLSEIITRGDLQSGITYALRRRGYSIERSSAVQAG